MADDGVAQVERRHGWQRFLGLRDHSLFRFAAAYGVAAWLIVQVAATIGPAFDLPHWFLRAVIVLAVLGFVLTLGIAALRQRGQSVPVRSQRRAVILTLGLAGLVAAVAGLGFLARDAVLGREQVTVAVLPFADLSPSRDKAYFAEGIAEEILSSLASEEAIKILGRTSARQLERNPDPAVLRASLGVTHLLEGSTRTDGDQLRVNVRLIDTSDGSELWEERYDGRLADVFGVQEQIAASVVKRLRGTISNDKEPLRPEAAPIDAYQSYLAARAMMRDPKKEQLTRALHLARQIVEAHPDYAQGHALLADATWLLADDPFSYGDIPVATARRITLAHAREAIRLAPNRAEGYAALSFALPPREAIAPLNKAIQLDRSWSALRGRLGIEFNNLQLHEKAFEQYRLGVEIDPLSSALTNRYVAALAASGRGDEAFRTIDLFVERGGNEAQAWRFRGFANSLLGKEARAVAARLRGLSLDPQLPYQAEWLAMSLNLLGFDEEESRYRTGLSPYLRLFLADDRGALKARVLADGPRAWSANKIEFAVFSLARARDWPAIVRIYDARPADSGDLCVQLPAFAPVIAMALDHQGRRAEGARIRECVQRALAWQLRTEFRSPEGAPGELELWQASLFAMRNDRRALDWLDRALARGWLGQYFSTSLTDWPQFDGLRADPRLASIQRRIDAHAARERADILPVLQRARPRQDE